jgi:hypothetical protein
MSAPPESQAAAAVLLVRPAAFAANPQTAGSNAFQLGQARAGPAATQAAALLEFEGLVGALRQAGVETVVVNDTASPVTPDAIFPNNWLSLHADGAAVLYPMMAANRRGERRRDVLELLSRDYGFRIERVIDLSEWEPRGQFLEGTGSMVLDRVHRVAYACLSPRTDLEVLAEAAQLLDYEAVAFTAVDGGGVPVYHTNVLMCVGADFAVLCEEAIPDAGQREAVRRRLSETGHELVPISLQQMSAFAGNMLELAGASGERLLVLSARAFESLDEPQRAALGTHCRLLVVPIPTIETTAGGSIRCMLAEIHLPRKAA